MAEDNRRDIVAEALQPVLEEGEAFNVFRHEGEVVVTDLETSSCSARHPRLYGRLLSLHTRIDEAGAGIGRFPMLLVLGFCVGLHLDLFDDLLGQALADQLDKIWFYMLVIFAAFQVLEMVRKPLQRAAYREGRDELYGIIAAEGLDRDRLLAMIEDDPAVSQVGYFLKLDTSPSNG